MKNYLYIAAVVLAGCVPKSAEPSKPINRVVCEGKFIEMSDYSIIMHCADGRVASYTSSRFSLNRDLIQTK